MKKDKESGLSTHFRNCETFPRKRFSDFVMGGHRQAGKTQRRGQITTPAPNFNACN